MTGDSAGVRPDIGTIAAARFLIATFNETQSFRFGYKRYEIFPFRIWPRRKDEKENEFQKLSARPIWSILGGVGGIGGVGGLAGTFLNLFLSINQSIFILFINHI